MKQLAIKGHTTRGKEVIEILEMLGGKVEDVYDGTAQDWVYIIDGEGFIDWDYPHDQYDIYTLEAFLEKFPYKVGDKAFAFGNKCTIIGAVWDESIKEVVYTIKLDTSKYTTTKLSYQLQSYKEETMEVSEEFFNKYCINCGSQRCTAEGEWLEGCKHYKEETIKIDIPKGYEFAGVDDDNQQVVFEKICCQYPKTCEECLKILGKTMNSLDNMRGYKYALFMRLQQLLICRDAYWKVVGEEMGLGKPWEPDWDNEDKRKYVITCQGNHIVKDLYYIKNTILAFPTEEMRDAFFENFKDLIERCKELL